MTMPGPPVARMMSAERMSSEVMSSDGTSTQSMMPLGGAGGLGGLAHDAGGLGGALAGARVRRDEDGVAGLQADERLEDGRGGGVGRRDDGGHEAERLGDLLVAEGGVVGDDVAGLHVLVLVVDVLGGVVVLDDLVLHDTVASLLDGHLGQRDAGLVGGHGGLIEDLSTCSWVNFANSACAARISLMRSCSASTLSIGVLTISAMRSSYFSDRAATHRSAVVQRTR